MGRISFRLNGVAVEASAEPDRALLEILRGEFALASPHFGCGSGECGACRVIVGDHAVTSCDTPMWSVKDKDVTTLEGLGSAEQPHPLQRAFIAEQAMQCGYCISGVLMSAAALLKRNQRPSESEVRSALDHNLCRCGAHTRIIRAVLAAANEMAVP